MATIYDLWLDRILGMALGKKLQALQKYQSSRVIYEHRSELKLAGDLEADKEMEERMSQKGIEAVVLTDASYPALLKEISNPPFCLYYKGDPSLFLDRKVAVVGARKASVYGKWVAENLSEELGRKGICVVSGMAAGIDSCAHQGALKANGKTAAVLGCGVDICYPAINRRLMKQIEEQGIVLSEYLPGTGPKPFQFPMRNRIISGLCLGTVVVEAGISSGSLITANIAGEQGREVFAVPGNINQINSIGSNKLIQDGAYPIAALQDVMRQLNIADEWESEASFVLGEDERQIYQILRREGELSFQELADRLGSPVNKISSLVTILELKGILQTSFGKIFIAKS